MNFVKPIAIIYNPNSGKKSDVRQLIQKRLDIAGIKCEFLLSTRPFMTWELARNLEIDNYSALVAVGGDGTNHDVVNGMLARKDGRRLPVAFLPNGTGNNGIRVFGLNDLTKALDYLVKGDLIRVDLTKVNLDYESDESIPADVDRNAHSRYMLFCAFFGMPARNTLAA
jgi:diacylglycerol kinase (ATP)